MHESQMSLPHNESGETNYTETNTTKKREDANRDGQPKLIYNTLRTVLHFLPQTPENIIGRNPSDRAPPFCFRELFISP